MSYWIENIGGDDANRKDQKLYYAELFTDIAHIGDGDVSFTADHSSVTAAPPKFGDQVLCLEDASVHVYQSNKTWIEL